MAQLTGNTGGQLQILPPVTQAGGRQRTFVAQVPLAAQAIGAVIGIARLPVQAAIVDITVMTDTSLGTATLSVGDAGTGNAAIYSAAFTLTATHTVTKVGHVGTMGVPIVTGYDSVSGAAAGHEDITLTVGTAALPASGNLRASGDYSID